MPRKVWALGVCGTEAELDLLPARDRIRSVGDSAAVGHVDGIADGAPIRAKSQQRTDGVHAQQHSSTTGRNPVVCERKMNIPATTYFPRESPPKYLRRWRA